jgi:hypothetical protein
LIHAFGKPAADLVEHKGGNNTHQGADYDKYQIVQDGITGYYKSIGGQKKIFEIFKADPGTFHYAKAEINPLKGDNKAKHGEVVIDKQIQEARNHHGVKGDEAEPALIVRGHTKLLV